MPDVCLVICWLFFLQHDMSNKLFSGDLNPKGDYLKQGEQKTTEKKITRIQLKIHSYKSIQYNDKANAK